MEPKCSYYGHRRHGHGHGHGHREEYPEEYEHHARGFAPPADGQEPGRRGQARAKRDVATAIYNHYLAQADRDVVDGTVFTVASGFLVGHLVHVLAYHPDQLRTEGVVSLLKLWAGFSSFGGFLA